MGMNAEDVYWNTGKNAIFISQDMRDGPKEGIGVFDRKIILMPGDGIDLSILGLSKKKPKKVQ
jgi:hypothetical protein